MKLGNGPDHWGLVSQSLHWLVVLLILGLAVVGLVMDELPNNATKVQVYALHKSTGLTVLALMLARIVWRLVAGAPRPVPGTPGWQRLAAGGTHVALYLVAIAMPVSGWLYNSASNFPLQWYGLFSVPALSGRDPDLKDFAHEAHETLFWILVLLVLLHVAAALYHHLHLKDRTLRRMLPAATKEP